MKLDCREKNKNQIQNLNSKNIKKYGVHTFVFFRIALRNAQCHQPKI